MAPRIDEFRVTRVAEQHMLTDHGVEAEEALEAAESTSAQYRSYYGEDETEVRYTIPGKTDAGRRLWVIFAHEGHGSGRIVTAYEPHGKRAIAHHRAIRGD